MNLQKILIQQTFISGKYLYLAEDGIFTIGISINLKNEIIPKIEEFYPYYSNPKIKSIYIHFKPSSYDVPKSVQSHSAVLMIKILNNQIIYFDLDTEEIIPRN